MTVGAALNRSAVLDPGLESHTGGVRENGLALS